MENYFYLTPNELIQEIAIHLDYPNTIKIRELVEV